MHYKEFTYFSFSTVNNCRCGWKDIFFSVVTNASNRGNGKAFPRSGWYCTAERGTILVVSHEAPERVDLQGSAKPQMKPLHGDQAHTGCPHQQLLVNFWFWGNQMVPPGSNLCLFSPSVERKKERLTRGFPNTWRPSQGGWLFPAAMSNCSEADGNWGEAPILPGDPKKLLNFERRTVPCGWCQSVERHMDWKKSHTRESNPEQEVTSFGALV